MAQTVRHMGAPAAPAEESNIASMTGTTGFGAAVALGGGYAIANEVCKKTPMSSEFFSIARITESSFFVFVLIVCTIHRFSSPPSQYLLDAWSACRFWKRAC